MFHCFPFTISLNQSSSVSWNYTGKTLASSSHAGAKIWSTDSLEHGHSSQAQAPSQAHAQPGQSQGQLREISNLHHNAPVDRIRFHPTEAPLLCTNAEDKTVHLWDVRAATRAIARIPLRSNRGNCAASIEWQTGNRTGSSTTTGTSNLLVVTERDNTVHVHDIRKLQNQGNGKGVNANTNGSSSPSEMKMYKFNDILADTHFSPSGTHLISAARRVEDGMGVIHIYPLDDNNSDTTSNANGNDDASTISRSTFVGHTGNIYSLKFSPDGTKMASGGNDALVGLWDVQSFVCKATISRRTKFIRSVAFSFDSKVVACCSEEKGIDLADADTGTLIGEVNLNKAHDRDSRDRGRNTSFGSGTMGADEIAFHPKAHIIAAARGENLVGQVPQVTIARLHYSQAQ